MTTRPTAHDGTSGRRRGEEPIGAPERVLVTTHTGRAAAVQATTEVLAGLIDAGITVAMLSDEAADIPELPRVVELVDDEETAAAEADLVIVLGGDGTILRAAQLTHSSGSPLLGVNLGHVGFLAEGEREDIAEVVRRVALAKYTVEERMTIDITVSVDGEVIASSFALNEATVEKGGYLGMLEVACEVDGRPVSTFGCDGVVMATPTGSTAYAFSAGGPVVWPEVEALLMVPICAHALFARPLVVSPDSSMAVELVGQSPGAVVVCDGRRKLEIPVRARVEVTRGRTPVRLARLDAGPFTDRLVAKFRLPVTGWRGPRGTVVHDHLQHPDMTG